MFSRFLSSWSILGTAKVSLSSRVPKCGAGMQTHSLNLTVSPRVPSQHSSVPGIEKHRYFGKDSKDAAKWRVSSMGCCWRITVDCIHGITHPCLSEAM